MSNHITIAYYFFPPWAYPIAGPDGRLKLQGMFGSLVDNITHSLNLTYDAFIPSDGLYGHMFPDGSWSGMLGSVQRQEADIGLGPFAQELNVFTDFDTMPFTEASYMAALTGMKKAFQTKPTPYTRAFEPITWYGIVTSIACLSALTICGRLISGSKLTFWTATSDIFSMMQTLLQESSKDRFNYFMERFNGGIWIIGSFILMQFFTQDLKANMVVKTPTMRINSLEDIIRNERLRIAYPIHTPVAAILSTIPGVFGEKVDSALKSRGIARQTGDIYDDEIISQMVKSELVIITEEVSMLYKVSIWCKTTPYYYYMGFENFRQMPAHIVFGKHVDPGLRERVRSKFYQIIAQKVPFVRSRERYPGQFDCVPSRGNQPTSTTEPLIVTDLEFPFKSHAIALSACCVFLCIEIVWDKIQRRFSKRSSESSQP